MTADAVPELCPKCRHRKTCKAPCRPVDIILAAGNRNVFEKHMGKDSLDRDWIIFFNRAREIPESLLVFEGSDDSEDYRQKRTFSLSEVPDPGSGDGDPFKDFTPQQKQAGIFFDRFFRHWSYEDIAEKWGISVKTAMSHFLNGKDKIVEMGKAMQVRDYAKHNIRLIRMPDSMRVFIMYAVLGLSVGEIRGILDCSTAKVMNHIVRMRDYILNGEIQLLEASDSDIETARFRLEKRRERGRQQSIQRRAGATT